MPRNPLKNKPLIEAIFESRWELVEPSPEMKVDPHYKIMIGRMMAKSAMNIHSMNSGPPQPCRMRSQDNADLLKINIT